MEVMPWIARLPDVSPPILAKREEIKALMLRATDLELQAAAVRSQAYVQATDLTSRVLATYPEAQIKEAQKF